MLRSQLRTRECELIVREAGAHEAASMDHAGYALIAASFHVVRCAATLHSLDEELVKQLHLLLFLLFGCPVPYLLQFQLGLVSPGAFGNRSLARERRHASLESIMAQVTLGLPHWLSNLFMDYVKNWIVHLCLDRGGK